VVHTLGDIFDHYGVHKIISYIKQYVEVILLDGTWLAMLSPALLIKPYQLLGENDV